MNFTLKTLVAAVALAACAGQASAALSAPTATTASDAIFFAIDQGAGTSFAYDLGNISVLSPSLNQGITGSAWTQFLAAEGNSLANVTWGIAYNLGDAAKNSLWGTTVTADGVIGEQDKASVNSGRALFNNFLSNTALTAAGTSAFTVAANQSNLTFGMANNWGGNASFTTDNAVGTVASFYTVTAANSVDGGVLNPTQFVFNGSTIAAVTAVPEPESYAMLLGGLLMIGAIARRRRI